MSLITSIIHCLKFFFILVIAGVETAHEKSVKMREERAQVSFELDKEKHVLRQMQGRRYDKQAPGEFKGTSNPAQPVYKQVRALVFWYGKRRGEIRRYVLLYSQKGMRTLYVKNFVSVLLSVFKRYIYVLTSINVLMLSLQTTSSNPLRSCSMQGHWQDPTLDELQKHDAVHQLQSHLTEVKANQKRKSGIRTCNVKTTRRLYTNPSMVGL